MYTGNILLNFMSFAVILITLIEESICYDTQKSFTIDYKRNQFLKDGQPFRYIAGGMHYFRIPRIHWQDRLLKAKAMGLNTIQTYVAWNVHEERPGEYNFDGENDLFHFIDLAQSNDLLVILRPGPYIDAEWEFGGFPWWLANDTSLIMRSSKDIRYINYVKSWFTVLLSKLKPKLYRNGGAVISFQVENEYGNYYACDADYMTQLKDIYQNILGDEMVLFTTDGYTDDYMQCGTISTLFKTIDFGTEITAENAFKQQRNYQENGPLVNSEYYTGWLDYWGGKHQTRSSEKIASYFDKILAMNASVNLYMFEGGTNFRFMNGVDMQNSKFLISPTSYDYDAPLSEAGDPTDKYFALRKIIKKYISHDLIPVPKATKKTAYGIFNITLAMELSSMIKLMFPNGTRHNSSRPLTMERINQGYGFILYRSFIPKTFSNQIVTLTIDDVHDRVIVIIDETRHAALPRGYVSISIPAGEKLELLVENQGRLAYGTKGSHYLPDAKGIIGDVKINNEVLRNWEMFPMGDVNLKKANKLLSRNVDIKSKSNSQNMFFYTNFYIDNITDTYIKLTGWTKGQIFVNYFNIGRYWQTLGPQKTLYVPKSALKVGKNEVLIFELDHAPCLPNSPHLCQIEFCDKPILQ